jgi:hypothetical protein
MFDSNIVQNEFIYQTRSNTTSMHNVKKRNGKTITRTQACFEQLIMDNEVKL